jgi:hypothetical protein
LVTTLSIASSTLSLRMRSASSRLASARDIYRK